MTDLAGRTFGPYTLWLELGRDDMGVVYKAGEPLRRRFVALRMLPPEWSERPDRLARFIADVRGAIPLEHSHIGATYAAGDLSGTYYVATQYLAGSTLEQFLSEWREPLSLAEVARLVTPLAAALDYAHAQGQLHLGIGPAHIHGAASGLAVLTGFGLARARYSAGLPSGEPPAAVVEMRAPEQAGAGPVDGRADVYALGAVAFRLLTGQVPFVGADGELQSPRQLNPDLPPEADAALRRALARQPDERFEHAGEFAQALLALAGAKPAPARPEPVAATPAAAPQTPPPPPARPPVRSRPLFQGTRPLFLAGGGLAFIVIAGLATWIVTRQPSHVGATATPAATLVTGAPALVGSPSQTPGPTATSTATALPPTLTPTLSPTPTSTPVPTDTLTATPEPPTATATPTATWTRVPTRIPTRTPAPTLAPTETPPPPTELPTQAPTERPPRPPTRTPHP